MPNTIVSRLNFVGFEAAVAHRQGKMHVFAGVCETIDQDMPIARKTKDGSRHE